MRKMLVAGLLLAAALALPRTAIAVDPETIVKALVPKPAPELTRSLRPSSTRGLSVQGAAEAEPPPSINLHINFEYNSATLTNDGTLAINALGTALKDKRLADMRFSIIGHTDARGTDEYNLGLSRRRADSVKVQLIQRGVAPSNLDVDGKGKRQLLRPDQPEHELNRRVEIVNIGATPAPAESASPRTQPSASK